MSNVVDHADTLMTLLRLLAPDLARAAQREFRFAPPRRWRFDVAWPAERVAVEVDGGQWRAGGGRHNTDADRDKLNAAAERGWRVLRYSPAQLTANPAAVIAQIRATLRLDMSR